MRETADMRLSRISLRGIVKGRYREIGRKTMDRVFERNSRDIIPSVT